MTSFLEVPEDLAHVQHVLGATLLRVERRVAQALASDLQPVQDLVTHAQRYHGKMLRPMLVTLAGLAVDPRAAQRADESHVTDAHVTLGAVVEMIHLSTLIHDDVLDEADQRRRLTTVNRLVGNEAAVILGDYLFSAAYRLCGQLGDAHAVVRIGQTGMTLCAGELVQLHNRGNFSLDLPTYHRIIDHKTASLIAVACELGARASACPPAHAQLLADFGTRLGLAFQIQDDLLDLAGDQAVVGKSLGKDAEKGKLTLPVIHHLTVAAPADRARTLELLAQASAGARAALASQLALTGSHDHARAQAQGHIDQAKALLATLHDSPARRTLHAMADAVVQRAW
jgi:octaprenyl-diphosphate synthase